MRGLPIGQGEIWHDPRQRRWLAGLCALAFVPTLALAVAGAGHLGARAIDLGVVAPVLGMVLGLALAGSRRYPSLFQRLAIGALSGMLGAITYDALCMLLQQSLPGGGPQPVWVGYLPPPIGSPASALAVAYGHQWLATAALWGMAYALVAGKARWGYGLAYSLGLGACAVAIAWTLAPGRAWLPELTWGALGALALAHVVFGVLLGFFNEQFQPATRANGKIIFLRDYQARVRERR